MPNSKKVVIGVLIFALFLIFLSWNGKIGEVVDVARQVLPSQPPVEPPAPAPEPIVIELPEVSVVDEKPAPTDTGLLKPNELVLVLDAIPGTGGKPVTDYDRDAFGSAWSDIDRNGCDQRNDTLTRDLTEVTYREGTNDCVVVAGVLDDPFTGKVINFVKAEASKVHIDHMIPLSWAWKNGASTWSDEQRLALANSPENLTAVSGSANSSKSDKGPGEWTPANDSYRCEYVTRFVHLVDSFKLTIDEKDRMAARRMLAAC